MLKYIVKPAGDDFFSFEVVNGEIHQIGQASKLITLKYKEDKNSGITDVYCDFGETAIDIQEKTQLVYGSVNEFLKVVETIPTDAEEKLLYTDDYFSCNILEINPLEDISNYKFSYKNIVDKEEKINSISTYFKKVESGDKYIYTQVLEVPGGIETVDSGNFSNIETENLTVTRNATNQTLKVNNIAEIETLKIKKYDPKQTDTTDSEGYSTLKKYIKDVIETEYLYDGTYSQN